MSVGSQQRHSAVVFGIDQRVRTFVLNSDHKEFVMLRKFRENNVSAKKKRRTNFLVKDVYDRKSFKT